MHHKEMRVSRNVRRSWAVVMLGAGSAAAAVDCTRHSLGSAAPGDHREPAGIGAAQHEPAADRDASATDAEAAFAGEGSGFERARAAYRAGLAATAVEATSVARAHYHAAIALLENETGESLVLSARNRFEQALEEIGFAADGTLRVAGRYESLSIGPDDWWRHARWEEPPIGYYGSVEVALSPDTTRLAISPPAGQKGAVVLRDAVTGTVVAELAEEPGYWAAMEWSPDGSLLATATRSVGIWDVSSLTRTASVSARPVYGFGFSHSGDLLAVGEDIDVTLRSAETGRLLQRGGRKPAPDGGPGWDGLVLTGHRSGVGALAFVPSDEHLITGDNQGGLLLWSPRTGKVVRKYRGHGDIVYSIVPTRDGRRFATASRDRKVGVWRLSESRPVRMWTAGEHGIREVAWSPDETRLVTCGVDQTVRWWDAESGEELRRIGRTSPTMRRIAFLDGRRLLATDGGAPRIVDLARRQVTTPGLPSSVTALAVIPEAELAVITGGKELLHGRIDGGSWRELSAFSLGRTGRHWGPARPTVLRASPQGTYLAALAEKQLWIWSLRDRRLIHKERVRDATYVDFSPDETKIAVSTDSALHVHHLPRPGSARTFPLPGGKVRPSSPSEDSIVAFAFTSNDRVWVGRSTGALVTYQVATGAVVGRRLLPSPVTHLAYGARTGLRVVATADGRVGVRRAGESDYRFMQHCCAAFHLALSPDEQLLAVAHSGTGSDEPLESAVQLWRVGSGDLEHVAAIRVIADHDAGVLLSQDGKLDFIGRNVDRAHDFLRCRVAEHSLPLAVCEDRFRTEIGMR